MIHDLGCGTGSMGRWLAPQLPGPQHWIMYDRDPDLLELAAADLPGRQPTGRGHRRDPAVATSPRLGPRELAGASLITASALLDMLTADELDALVAACADAGCPVLVTLSVTGRVEFEPGRSAGRARRRRVQRAPAAHHRRPAGCSARTLSRPPSRRSAGAAPRCWSRPSPWRLGAAQAEPGRGWFAGWVGAACEQRPDWPADGRGYAGAGAREAAAGRLAVTVHHADLLVRAR